MKFDRPPRGVRALFVTTHLVAGVLMIASCGGGKPVGDLWGDNHGTTNVERPPTGDGAVDGGAGDASGDGQNANSRDGAAGDRPSDARGAADAVGGGGADVSASVDGPVASDAAATGDPLAKATSAACTTCLADRVASGDCDPPAGGCAAMPDATRVTGPGSCEAMFLCIQKTGCAFDTSLELQEGRTKATNCLCGHATGTACASAAANGACLDEIRAAGLVTDPNDNTSPGTRFFSEAFPEGYAGFRTQCMIDFCWSQCSVVPDPRGTSTSDAGGTGDLAGSGDGSSTGGSAGTRDAGSTGGSAGTGTGGSAGTGGTLTTGGSGGATGGTGGSGGSSATGGTGGSTSGTDSGFSIACNQCLQGHIDSGDCDPPAAGCSTVTTGAANVALCEAAFSCMTTKNTAAGTRCWASGKTGDCLCGSAAGVACASAAANGLCKTEIRAAGLVTDPNDYISPGTRLFSEAFPIGPAAFRVQCASDFCADECMHPATGGTGGSTGTGGGGGSTGGTGGSAGTGGSTGGTGGSSATGGTGAAGSGGVGGTGAAGTSGSGGVGGAAGAGGTGGTGAAGVGGVGGAAGTGGVSAGTGGATGGQADASVVDSAPDAPSSVCPDLDGDGKLDCQQGLAKNPGFNGDASNWTAEPYSAKAFDSRDGANRSGSGSLLVTNTNFVGQMTQATMSGSVQCVAVTAGAAIQLYAQTFIPAGQGPGAAGVAGWFFDSSDCSGAQHDPFVSPLITSTNHWTVVHQSVTAPGVSKSMLVRLVVQKPFDQITMAALFDNVLVRSP